MEKSKKNAPGEPARGFESFASHAQEHAGDQSHLAAASRSLGAMSVFSQVNPLPVRPK